MCTHALPVIHICVNYRITDKKLFGIKSFFQNCIALLNTFKNYDPEKNQTVVYIHFSLNQLLFKLKIVGKRL